MGRAIVRSPQAFLFDEPLSNLDANLRVQMRAEIRELHQRLRTTTVYVTHDQIEAMTMADKIVVMNAGRVEQAGAPLEVYDRPRNRFVAGFIGSPSMNLMEATAGEAANGSARMRVGDAELSVPAPGGLGAGRAVTVGVRPEHFSLAEDGLEARVRVVEPTGSETHLVLEFQGREITAVFRERRSFRPGDALRLGVEADKVHLFAGEGGERIN